MHDNQCLLSKDASKASIKRNIYQLSSHYVIVAQDILGEMIK